MDSLDSSKAFRILFCYTNFNYNYESFRKVTIAHFKKGANKKKLSMNTWKIYWSQYFLAEVLSELV